MKPIKTIVIITAAVTFTLPSSCRHHKKHHVNTSQQQEFPVRTIGTSAQQDYSENEQYVDSGAIEAAPDSTLITNDKTQQKSLTLNDGHEHKQPPKDANKQNNKVALKKRHKLPQALSSPLAEGNSYQENAAATHHENDNTLMATTNNVNRDEPQSEERQEVERYSAPKSIVQMRPVTPRGKFRKFDPRKL